MARYKDCIAALARAAGRELTDEEVAAIFERIHKAALDIKAGRAEVDEVGMPKGGARTKDLRADIKSAGGGADADATIQMVAERAARELEGEAAAKERDAQLQVTALARVMGDMKTVEAAGLDELSAADRTIFRDYTGKFNIQSLEQLTTGHEHNLLSQLGPVWEALGDEFFGFFQNRVKMVDLIREIRGEDTGNALAKKGAKAWIDTAEQARLTFNEYGGKVGKLDEGYIPQHHSQERVARAGKENWIDQIMPFLERDRYVDEITGQRWSDAEMREFLGYAYDTISTDGISKLTPGQPQGFGKRANRHSAHRQIHFKDAESLIAYWEIFGDRSFLEITFGHIATMAKDIALVQWGGPNPHMTFQTIKDDALQRQALRQRVKLDSLKGKAQLLNTYYDYVSGQKKPPFSVWFRRLSQGLANAAVFGKLGSASVTSFFGDKPMFEAVAHLSNLPKFKLWTNELALLNPTNRAERRSLMRYGMMLDSIMSNLHKFGDDLGTKRGWTGKMANAVMSMTGMQLVNDGRKGAFEMTLYDSIGYEISRGVTFDQLHSNDLRVLKTFGVTEQDWKVWSLAELEDYRRQNHTLLTPDGISNITDQQLRDANIIGPTDDARAAETVRRDARVKLLGAVHTEGDFAVVTPGWKERAQFYALSQPGTAQGEIWNAMLKFKSFPWTMFRRTMDVVANKETGGGKFGMAMAIVISTTLAGAMTMQTKEMLAGKDPRKMFDENWKKFWASAFLYGGAAGFYGDFVYSANQTRYGSGPIEAISGPTLGPLMSLLLTQPLNAARGLIDDEDTHFMSRQIQQGKGFIPMNNALYLKGAVDHLLWHNVMENLNPGYLRRMKRRTAKEFDQDWWWDPGTNVPQRSPDIARTIETGR